MGCSREIQLICRTSQDQSLSPKFTTQPQYVYFNIMNIKIVLIEILYYN